MTDRRPISVSRSQYPAGEDPPQEILSNVPKFDKVCANALFNYPIGFLRYLRKWWI